MTTGTKSLLFGVHLFWLHPFYVALAWWKLYRFRRVEIVPGLPVSLWNPRLWVLFAVHDLGYLGKTSMDGPDDAIAATEREHGGIGAMMGARHALNAMGAASTARTSFSSSPSLSRMGHPEPRPNTPCSRGTSRKGW